MSKAKLRRQETPLLQKQERPYKAIPITEEPILSETPTYAEDMAAMQDATRLMQLFIREDWVFITADLLASNFAMPWPRIFKQTIQNGRATKQPVDDHPVQVLLEDPALFADAQSFWYVAGIYDCMLGNTIIWHMEASNKLMVIPAHEVSIQFSKKGLPEYYVWTPTLDSNRSSKFSAKEIIHVRRPNPLSQFWGLSPFIPGNKSVLFNRYSGDFLNSFFEKGATPQIIVETEIGNNAEAIKTLAKSFELVNSGRRNYRRPLVLPKGAKATQINMTIADTKLFDFINQNREVILNLLRVPKHAVGLQTAGSLGSEEHKTALRFMWGSTVSPMLKRYATALTKHFQKKALLSNSEYIDFDSSDIEIANEDMNRRADFAVKLSKTHTINEIRLIVYGEQPINGGDFIPGILDSEGNAISKNPSPTGGEQPAQETMPPPAQPPEATPTAKWSKIADIEKSEELSSHTKSVEDELIRTEEQMIDLSSELIIRQLEKALGLLKEEIPQKSKAVDYDALEEQLNALFIEDLPNWQQKYKDILTDTPELGYATQLKLVFDPVHREALAALKQETAPARKAILAGRGIESFKNISAATTFDIVDKVAEGVKAGSTLSEISSSIATSFKETTWKRARVIARTETLTAISVGQDSACKNAARVIPDAIKVWIASKDNRVRDTHENIHGTIVKATEKFRIVGRKGKITEMNVPRDPKVKGSPEEIIQCRCTVAVVAPEDRDLIKL